ncbi:MAG TPA: hypothetical protein VF203_14655 [Burkholderiales bacterium]
MFSYLMGLVQEFEKRHGRRPQVVYLNARHMRRFMEECPDLFDPETAMPLGFRIVVLPESELSQPRAAWLPRRRTRPRGADEPDLKLLAWDRGRLRRARPSA